MLSEANAEFCAAMEDILDVYRQPYDPMYTAVFVDETPSSID
ncbi:MAG: hypothetical protein ACTXOO_04635 [Sodalis sp. (in: enterobacteria)]